MLKNYVKIALKVLLRRKFFTFISLFGISFTLLVLMLVVAGTGNFLTPAKPGSKLDRSMMVPYLGLTIVDEDGSTSHGITFPSYYFLNKYVKTLKGPKLVAIYSMALELTNYHRNKRINISLKFTDSEFWEIVELDFLHGRPYSKSEFDDAKPVAVITERLGREYFGDESPVGEYIEADGTNYRIVGVVRNEDIPSREVFSDIYAPATTSKSDINTPRLHGRYRAFVLAHDKGDNDNIKREYYACLKNIEDPEGQKIDSLYSDMGTPMDYLAARTLDIDNFEKAGFYLVIVIVLGMVLFMILPAINLVNINISRIIERSSEIGIRKAFGASSWTLVWQFIVENIILTLIGGIIGFILSIIVLEIINDSGIVPYGHFAVNIKIFLISLAVCLFFGLFSGVYPAFRMSRMHPVEALRGAES